MPVVFSALMCHAPIVIPAVAGQEAARCRRTTRAMREVAQRVVASRPDRLVLVSPHTQRHARAWGAWQGRVKGDLGRFRTGQIKVDLPPEPDVIRGLRLEPVDMDELDHGAMVPLAFLWDAGWRGPTAVISLPWHEDTAQTAEDLGRDLSRMAGRTAVIASGDMSHRLKPGAPAGFHPRAQEFDDGFVEALRNDDWSAALAAEPRQLAAEDVVESSRVAMAAASGVPVNAEVLSYEGPWGVGYTEAIFHDAEPPLYAVARRAVVCTLEGAQYAPPPGGPRSAGVFVTLRKEGRLRGCIGHIEPTRDRLYEEVATAALAAATRDPRFQPVTVDELEDVRYEVSVLEPPEAIASTAELDPRTWGVIVSDVADPRIRGLLLPDIEGIDTVDEQVAIATRKARIPAGAPVNLERFRVRKVAEP